MNITSAFNNRCFLIPKADFPSSSHEELIKLIFEKHGESNIDNIKIIDENDDYDSFLVEINNQGFLLKISFDEVPIFYEFMVLKGIQHLSIAPTAIDRNEIDFGKTVFYTIQSFEYSENLMSIGGSSILQNEFSNFNEVLAKMHKYTPPEIIFPHLDDTASYLQYQNVNFDKILSYVDNGEEEIFSFIKKIHSEVYEEMINLFESKKNNLKLKKMVHGNLDSSTIIANSFRFKFINFENCFIGSPFFDISNLVFELQMNGINEFDFVTKKIQNMGIVENRLKSSEFINEYKICKDIWTRKKFLDILKEYTKEIIILNSSRIDKMARLAHEFSNHFYRFSEIPIFEKNKDIFIKKFSDLILNK